MNVVILGRVMGCVAVVLGAAGCAPTLTAAGAGVKFTKEEPPKGCTEVGTVEGNWAVMEAAKADARNHAAERGANYVRWDTTTSRFILTGTAFQCPPEALK